MSNFISEKSVLNCKDRDSLMESLKSQEVLYRQYQALNQEWQERFLDYCLGKKTLPITYDPFFVKIFHPDVHPERLSRLISSLLGISVKVVKILPSEETLLDGGALLILDILVELEDGSLANVEVQKIPYLFPAERMSCYSADLVLRQYSRVKGERLSKFKYDDLKKVYTIVIFEKSIAAFHGEGMHYLHKGKTVFDTGLKLELLQEYCLLALDVFREKDYPKDGSEQTAWISFLATDSLEMAEKLIEDYPWLEEIYREMADYLHKPEEVLGMFSEALKVMDQNTVQYMIELQQQQLDEAKAKLSETQGRLGQMVDQLNETEHQLGETQGRLDETQGKLDETQGKLSETQGKLDETQGKLDETQGRLGQMVDQLNETEHQLGETQGKLDETQGKLDETQGKLDRSIEIVLKAWRSQGLSDEEITVALQNEFNMSIEEVQKYIGN